MCGSRLPAPVWVATSRRWTDWLPIHVFVIEHPEGLVIFDLGQDVRSVQDGATYYGRHLLGRLLRRSAVLDVPSDQTLPTLLHTARRRRPPVHTVVLSHFHPDHIGGLRDIPVIAPDARVVASQDELDTLGARRPELSGVLPQHIDLPGLRWQPTVLTRLHGRLGGLRGMDLMGDESLIVLPTPGHTAGSQSLLVSPPGRTPMLVVGDAGFREDLMREGRLPGVGDPRQMGSTTTMLTTLADSLGAVLLPAHDPDTAPRLRQAQA
ncbi:MAG: MBL fold metallo-hydrolase [Dermatophilaceae bacterium]